MTAEPVELEKPAKRTEAEMLDLLRKRHTSEGRDNGAWAFMTHVRDESGFKATRTIDAIAMSLWESRGLELHGFEVKVSRADWLRELAHPEKADGYIGRVDRWWLVAAEGVAKAPEMPTGWGLMVAQGDKLRVAVQAPLLERTPEQKLISRSWLVCLLRSAGAVPKSRPEDIVAANEQGFRDGVESAKRNSSSYEQMYKTASQDLRTLRETVSAFQRESGLELRSYGEQVGERAAKIGQLVNSAMQGDQRLEASRQRLLSMAVELNRAAGDLRQLGGGE